MVTDLVRTRWGDERSQSLEKLVPLHHDMGRGLMNVYRTKYPAEFSDWEGRQRSGFQTGERILLRYSALPSSPATNA